MFLLPVDDRSRLQYAAFALEFAAVGAAAFQLRELRKHYGLPPLSSRILGWLGGWRDVIRGRPVQVFPGSGGIVFAPITSASGRMSTMPGYLTVLGARIWQLEQELDALKDSVNTSIRSLENQVAEVSKRQSEQVADMMQQLERLRKEIRDASVANLDPGIIGLTWLASGLGIQLAITLL